MKRLMRRAVPMPTIGAALLSILLLSAPCFAADAKDPSEGAPRSRKRAALEHPAEDAVLPPGGARHMLPERQRLLETRLESSSWRPFNGFGVRSAWERGPRGRLDLSLGLALGNRDGVRNLALNGDLELTPWLRTHFTAVARPHHTR